MTYDREKLASPLLLRELALFSVCFDNFGAIFEEVSVVVIAVSNVEMRHHYVFNCFTLQRKVILRPVQVEIAQFTDKHLLRYIVYQVRQIF